VLANRVRLAVRAGDVFLGGPLGQKQHLESLTLVVGIGIGIGRGTGRDVRLLQGLAAGTGRPEQPFHTALHPTIGHRTTSLSKRSLAPVSASAPTPLPTLRGGMLSKLSRLGRVERPDVIRRSRMFEM